MRNILAFVLNFAHAVADRRPAAPHDDTLRANQFNGPRPALSPWLILIS